MDNYKELELEVIFFEDADIIITSNGNVDTDPIPG